MQFTITETATMPLEHPLTQALHPRFTPQEAVVLNMIVSSAPGYITHDQIARKIHQTMRPTFWGGATRNSIQITICTLRAKLGEPKWKPRHLISVYEIKPNGTRGKIVGYTWRS